MKFSRLDCERPSREQDKEVILLGKEKKEVTEQEAAMTIRYGNTLYNLIFRCAEKGKATMNDKVWMLIRSNALCEPTS